jgi:PIN domain nuclease of toxin-antitoxin system
MLGAPRKLGTRAAAVARRVETGHDVALIPAAVVAEVALSSELDRTSLGVRDVRVAFDETPALRFLPLDLDQLDMFTALPMIRDPFDRLIVSAARVHGARLVTRDEALGKLGLVHVVWS